MKNSRINSENPCDVNFMGNIKISKEAPIRVDGKVKLTEPLLEVALVTAICEPIMVDRSVKADLEIGQK